MHNSIHAHLVFKLFITRRRQGSKHVTRCRAVTPYGLQDVLKMGAKRYSETLVWIHKTTRHHVSEDHNWRNSVCFTVCNAITFMYQLRSDVKLSYYCLHQRDPTGGPRATSGPRPLVTRTAKVFVDLLLVTKSPFISFTPEDLKKSWFLSRLLLYVQVQHMLLTLKPYCKM
jgi:hypothetical protein